MIAREETISAKTKECGGTSKDVVRIEVLEKKIKVDSKNHENEKEKITIEKEKAIRNLETENDNLKIEVANKNDKIKQLDIANDKKEFLLKIRDHDIKELRRENEDLRQRADELQTKIAQLEEERKQLSEKYQETIKTAQKQQKEIKSMEIRINLLKEELDSVREERMEQEKKILDQMKSMESKMAEINSDARSREFERERKMTELLKRQEEEAKRRERMLHEEMERRETLRVEREKKEKDKIHEHLDRVLGEVLKSKTEIKKDIKETATIPNQKQESFVITEAQNLQVQSGNHYYIQQTSRRQMGNSSKSRLQPPVQLSLPSSIRSFQNRRVYCPSYKLPTYKK